MRTRNAEHRVAIRLDAAPMSVGDTSAKIVHFISGEKAFKIALINRNFSNRQITRLRIEDQTNDFSDDRSVVDSAMVAKCRAHRE